MEYKLQDLIDIEQFQALQDRLNEIYSFPSAIIDNEGNILTATAWQDICTKFHRMNKECEKECIKSDRYILSHLHESNPAVSYRCPHGLVDNATPIIIDGTHYGNFFTGQFFLESPNLEFFREQAQKYGFDEQAYLDAVKKVPVWSKKQLNSYLFFIKGLIEVISSSGLKKLKEIEARRKIEESEERASTILNQMMDGFWIVDRISSKIVDVNPAICEMLGYARDELLALSIKDVEAIDSPEEIQQRISQIVRDGSANFQSHYKRKDGTLIDVEVSVKYLPSSNQFFAIHRDITERKQREKQLSENEQRFRSMFEQAPIGMGLIESHTNKFLQVNPKYCEIVGRTKEELQNMDFHTITHPDDIGIDLENKQKLIDGEIRSYELDKRYIKPDQSVVWTHLTIVALWKEDDKPKHHLTMVEDITERKLVQEELLKSEERFRSLYENATVGMYRTTPDGEILLANPTLVNMLGYDSFDDLAARNLEQEGYDPKYERSMFRRQIENEGIVIGLESAWTRKDGETIYVRESAKAIRDKDGKVIYYEGTVEDITERMRIEEALRENQSILSTAEDVAKVGSWKWDLHTQKVSWSDGMFRLFRVEREGFDGDVNQVVAERIHPEDAATVQESNRSVLEEAEPIPLSYRIILPDGNVRTVWAQGKLSYDEMGSPVALTGYVQDITESIQTENALRESEERLHLFIEHAPASLAMFDRKMRYLAVSNRWLGDYQLGNQNIIGKSHYEIFPEISDEWKTAHQRGMAGEVVRAEDDKFVRADGSVHWLKWEVRPWYENNGIVGGIVIFTEDITEHKHAEAALLESEERFHHMFENHNAVMLLIEPESGGIIDANVAAHNFYGYSIETLKQMKIQDINILPSDDVAKYRRQASTGSLNFFVFPHRLASGDIRTVEIHSSPIMVQGRLILFSIIHDVTEKKQVEQKIQEHLQRLDALRKIDQAISSSFDLNISLNILLSHAIRLLDVDAAAVLRLNPELHLLEFITGIGFKTEVVKKSRIRLGESYAGKAAMDRQVILVQNIANEPDNLFTHGFLNREEFVSYYGAPLIVKGKVIGVLEAYSRSYIERDREWLDFFNALAGQAGIAMDNLTLFNDLQNSNLELLMAYDATIEGWSRAMDLRDEETEGHARRVTDLTLKLAERMGIERAELVHIRRGALLHDIGKLGVPDQILRKPGKLTDEEWKTMRKHPIHAMEMLKPISYLRPAIDIPYCHHERWNGSGYPRGLRGEQIPLAARLFAIIDVWDALRSDRPYRPAWTEEKTLEYIKSQSGSHFDPEIVDVFFDLIGEV